MAIYVEVIKSKEFEDNFIHYVYQTSLPANPFRNSAGKLRYESRLVAGKLKIDKRNGKVHVLKFAEGDEKKIYAERAAYALVREWRKGEYPEKTCWAS